MALRTRVEIALENGALLYAVMEPQNLTTLHIPYFIEQIPVRRLVIGTLFTIPSTEQGVGGNYRIKDIKTYISDPLGNTGIDSRNFELHLIYIVEPVVLH